MNYYQYTTFFAGKFIHNLDSKNRLNIPSQMRQALPAVDEGTFFVTRGRERCLHLYPKNFWPQYVYSNWDTYYSNSLDTRRKALKRQMITEMLTMDPQGRITLSRDHTEYAGIKKEVVIIGYNVRIELWEPEEFEKFIESDTEDNGIDMDLVNMNPYNNPSIAPHISLNPYQPGYFQPIPGPMPGSESVQMQNNPGTYANPMTPPQMYPNPAPGYYPGNPQQMHYPQNPYVQNIPPQGNPPGSQGIPPGNQGFPPSQPTPEES